MPRPLAPPPASSPALHHSRHHLLLIASASAAALLLVLLLLLLLLLSFLLRRSRSRSRSRHQTLPVSSPPPPDAHLRRFSFRLLRRATSSFHPSRSLGRGASASVFLALLPSPKSPPLAVKLFPFSSPPLAELRLLSSLPPSPFLLPLLGHSLSSSPRRPHLLVFPFMPHGSLQDALFNPSPPPLRWPRRFAILLDVARALAFLHLHLDPPVVHGDLKPSNVLLGPDFRAKLADFGLARFKSPAAAAAFAPDSLGPSQELALASSSGFGASPGLKEPPSASPGPRDDEGFDQSRELGAEDWWWKQEESGELDSRDYVAEWIGSQIGGPAQNPDWDDERKSSPGKRFELGSSSRAAEELPPEAGDGPPERKKQKKTGSADGCETKDRKMREWWKEEYFAEMSGSGERDKRRRSKWFRSISTHRADEAFTGGKSGGFESNADVSSRKEGRKERKRSQSAGSGSDFFSSGDLLSRELSSTTSMRGTVCYAAPEYGASGHPTEKVDIYSFGVLVLVVLSGRRPLHVLSSPMKLEQANLISWCRRLARDGDALEIMDGRLKGAYDKEQAALCIRLALSCLNKMPESRPDGGEIVQILKGEAELPAAPTVDCSPSPRATAHSRSRSRSRRKTATS